jgi:hypothetical protein
LINQERLFYFAVILATPSDIDHLCGHRMTQDGDMDRHVRYRLLPLAYAAHQQEAHGC